MDTFILAVLSWPAYSAGWPNCHDSGRAERLSQLTGGVSPSATPSDTGGRLADPMPAGDTGPLCTTSDPARGVAWGGCTHADIDSPYVIFNTETVARFTLPFMEAAVFLGGPETQRLSHGLPPQHSAHSHEHANRHLQETVVRVRRAL